MTTDRLAALLAKAHYDLVAPILSEDEYAAMAAYLGERGVRVSEDAAPQPDPAVFEAVERMREPLLAIGKELADYYDARCPDCSHEWRDHGPGGCSYRAKDEADMPCVCTEERGMTRG